MRLANRFFVGVTGAQGVGKTTFCCKLQAALRERSTDLPITLLAGIGQEVKDAGYSLGQASTDESVRAIVLAHLKRIRRISAGIVILDRCPVDMLAYVRTLNVSRPLEAEIFQEFTEDFLDIAALVIRLQLSATFATSQATHERPGLRREIDAAIDRIVSTRPAAFLTLDAADNTALLTSVQAVQDRLTWSQTS